MTGIFDPKTGAVRGTTPERGSPSTKALGLGNQVGQAVGQSWVTAVMAESGSDNAFGPVDFGFNPFADPVVRERPELWSRVSGATNQAHLNALVNEYDFDNVLRRNSEDSDAGLAAHALAGIMDPANIVPVPVVRGLGFVKGAMRGGMATAGVAAAAEGMASAADLTRTSGEFVANVGLSAVLGGSLSGLYGGATRALGVEPIVPEMAVTGTGAPSIAGYDDLLANLPSDYRGVVAGELVRLQRDGLRLKRAADHDAASHAELMNQMQRRQFRDNDAGDLQAATDFEELVDQIANPLDYTDDISTSAQAAVKVRAARAGRDRLKAIADEDVVDHYILNEFMAIKGMYSKLNVSMQLSDGRVSGLRVPQDGSIPPGALQRLEALQSLLEAQNKGRGADAFRGYLDAITEGEEMDHAILAALRAGAEKHRDRYREGIGRPKRSNEMPDGESTPEVEAKRQRPDDVEELTYVREGRADEAALARAKHDLAAVQRQIDDLAAQLSKTGDGGIDTPAMAELIGDKDRLVEEVMELDAKVRAAEDGVVGLGKTRIKGGGAEHITWDQMPWYRLMNNVLPGRLGEAFRDAAGRLAANPGMRTEGAGQGQGMGASVEFKKLRWYAMERETEHRVFEEYARYASIEMPTEERGLRGASTVRFGVKAKQGLENAASSASQKLSELTGAQGRMQSFRERTGLVSLDEFMEQVTVALAHGGELPANLVKAGEDEAVRRAAVAMREFMDKTLDDMEQVGLVRSRGMLEEDIRNLNERIDAAQEEAMNLNISIGREFGENEYLRIIAKHMNSESSKELDTPGLDERRKVQIREAMAETKELLDSIGPMPSMSRQRRELLRQYERELTANMQEQDRLNRAFEQANEALNAYELQGATQRQSFVHTLYDKQAIVENRADFEALLVNYFRDNPMIWNPHSRRYEQAAMDEKALKRRATEATDRILDSTPNNDPESKARALNYIRERLDDLKTELRSVMARREGTVFQERNAGVAHERLTGDTGFYRGKQYVPAIVKLNRSPLKETEGKLDVIRRELAEAQSPLLQAQLGNGWDAHVKRLTEAEAELLDELDMLEASGASRDQRPVIIVDEEFIRAEFAKGKESGALDPGIYDDFGNADDVIRWAELHEELHIEMRQRPNESAVDYEKRINETAAAMMMRDLPEYQKKLHSPTSMQIRKEMLDLQRREWELIEEDELAVNPFAPSKTLNIPAKYVLPFIENDARVMLRHYTRQVHAKIELAREFGDANLSTFLQEREAEVEAHIAKNDLNATEARELRRQYAEQKEALRDLRDVVQGHYGMPENPDAMAPRVAKLLKQHVHLALMGMTTLTAFGDTGKIAATYGLRPIVGVMHRRFRALRNDPDAVKAQSIAESEVQATGVAEDVVQAARVMGMADLGLERVDGGPANGSMFSKYEQLVASATNKLFLLNGLSLWTDHARRFAGTMGMDHLVRGIEGMRAGKMSEVELARLARSGVTPELAEQIGVQLDRYGSELDGLRLPNTGAWDDEAAVRAFRAILAQDVAHAVVTPGAADNPIFMRKWLPSLMLQYLSFGMSMTQRAGMSFIAHRGDAMTYVGIGSMLAMSAAIDEVKRHERKRWSLGDATLNAVERSAMMGVFTDMNKRLEYLTQGNLGLRPALGMKSRVFRPNWSHTAGAIGGPAAGLLSAAAWAYTDEDATGYDQARAIRYLMPLANLWIWNQWMGDMQRAFGRWLEED